MNDEQLDKFIELFFFDPALKTNDSEYDKLYQKVCAKQFSDELSCRYSPLYLLLKDIRFCYGVGKQFNPIRENLEPADYAGILLIDAGFNMIEKICHAHPEGFGIKYMGFKNQEEQFAFRLLRNCFAHKNYGLKNSHKGKPIFFNLSYNHPLIEKHEIVNAGKSSILYLVNPRRLFSAFTEGVKKIKVDILEKGDPNRPFFKSFLNVNNWIMRDKKTFRIQTDR